MRCVADYDARWGDISIRGSSHPHVTAGGEYCLGMSDRLIRNLIVDGQLVSAAAVLRGLLEHPNWRGALAHRRERGKLACTICGKHHDYMYVCHECYRRVGGDCCSERCPYTGRIICTECAAIMTEKQFEEYMYRRVCIRDPYDPYTCTRRDCPIPDSLLAWHKSLKEGGS